MQVSYIYFMMTSLNWNIFRVTGPLCGEFAGYRWIPRTKDSDAEPWCFLWSRLNKRLSKQSRCWWSETPSRPLWRHCNEANNRKWKYDDDVGWLVSSQLPSLTRIGMLRTIIIYSLVIETFVNMIILKFLSRPNCPENFTVIHQKLFEVISVLRLI